MIQNLTVTFIIYLIASSVIVINCSISSISRTGFHENTPVLSLGSKRKLPGNSPIASRVYKRGMASTSRDLSFGNDFGEAAKAVGGEVNPMNLATLGPEDRSTSILETGQPYESRKRKTGQKIGKPNRRTKRSILEVGTHQASIGDGQHFLNQASSLPGSEKVSKRIKLRIPIR